MNNEKTSLIAMLLALTACGQGGEPETARQKAGTPPIVTDSVAEAAAGQRTASPQGATVSFVTPRNGAVVSSPFRVEPITITVE